MTDIHKAPRRCRRRMVISRGAVIFINHHTIVLVIIIINRNINKIRGCGAAGINCSAITFCIVIGKGGIINYRFS